MFQVAKNFRKAVRLLVLFVGFQRLKGILYIKKKEY